MLWPNSQWTDANEHLPPRFGIVTSNTAESAVNSMFNAARDFLWMDALKNIIDVMIRQICACRKNMNGVMLLQSYLAVLDDLRTVGGKLQLQFSSWS